MALKVLREVPIATDTQVETAREYKRLSDMKNEIEREMKRLQTSLVVGLSGANRILDPADLDRNIVLLSTTETTKFAAARFTEDHPDLAREYTETTIGTRVTISRPL